MEPARSPTSWRPQTRIGSWSSIVLAGRGVGLDVVKNNLANLNGEIEIETEKGFGTRFTLKVPLTLIISQALFVQCGPQTFAFPLGFVEEIRRIRASDVEEVAGDAQVDGVEAGDPGGAHQGLGAQPPTAQGTRGRPRGPGRGPAGNPRGPRPRRSCPPASGAGRWSGASRWRRRPGRRTRRCPGRR